MVAVSVEPIKGSHPPLISVHHHTHNSQHKHTLSEREPHHQQLDLWFGAGFHTSHSEIEVVPWEQSPETRNL